MLCLNKKRINKRLPRNDFASGKFLLKAFKTVGYISKFS